MYAAFYHPDGFIGLLTIHSKTIHSGEFPFLMLLFTICYIKLWILLYSEQPLYDCRQNKEVKILIIFDLYSLYCFF